MGSKFIKINDYILQKKEISWVDVTGTKVTIRMNNQDTVTNVTETEEEAQELFDEIWNILDMD